MAQIYRKRNAQISQIYIYFSLFTHCPKGEQHRVPLRGIEREINVSAAERDINVSAAERDASMECFRFGNKEHRQVSYHQTLWLGHGTPQINCWGGGGGEDWGYSDMCPGTALLLLSLRALVCAPRGVCTSVLRGGTYRLVGGHI
ncbi:hypothetical protein XENTR_v10019844 [Xenopus tropicalis]|nr:hypothetical protein XENTR_v10019844 [Xenopus tropicalis]